MNAMAISFGSDTNPMGIEGNETEGSVAADSAKGLYLRVLSTVSGERGNEVAFGIISTREDPSSEEVE